MREQKYQNKSLKEKQKKDSKQMELQQQEIASKNVQENDLVSLQIDEQSDMRKIYISPKKQKIMFDKKVKKIMKNSNKVSEIQSYQADMNKDIYKDMNQEMQKYENVELLSEFQAFMMLLNSFYGPQILSMPRLFQETGVIQGIVIQCISAFASMRCLLILIQIQDAMADYKIDLYSLMKHSIGKSGNFKINDEGAQIFNIFFTIYCMGTSLLYPVYYSAFFNVLVEQFFHGEIHESRLQISFIALLCSIPLFCESKFQKQWKISFIANILNYLCVLLICIWCIYIFIFPKDKPNFGSKETIKSNSLFAMGQFLFAQQGICTLFTIRRSMKHPKKFKKLLFTTFAISNLTFAIFSIFCNIAINRINIKQNIIYSVSNQTIFQICLLVFSVNLMISVPIMLFSASEVFETMKSYRVYLKQDPESAFRKYAIRIQIASFIIMISNSQINLIIVNVTAMISLVLIQFIFPMIAYNKYFGTFVSSSDKITHALCMIIGISGCSYTIYYTLHNYQDLLQQNFLY